MTTTQSQLFAPPTRSNAVDGKGFLAIPFRQWLFTLQNLLPLVEVDTSGGDEVLQLPPAGLNENTGQSNQNQEIVYVKTSSDGNSASITGAETGAIILRKQWDSARFKSDGTNWVNSGVGSSSGPGAASFALLTSGENNDAAMVVGHGASLSRDGDGLIDASEIGGIKIPAGTAASTVGKVPISQGDGTAAWADPLVQGILPPGTNADTGNGGAPINPVLGGARRTTDTELQDLSCDADNNLNVNVQASVLPTGASTAANQATAITALAAILAALAATLNVDVLSSVLPTGASTSANQTNGSQKAQSVDGAGNVQPAGDTPARSIQVEQTDGANVIGTAAHPTRIDPTGTTTQPVNTAQIAGTATSVNSGGLDNGSQRVVIASGRNLAVVTPPAPGVDWTYTIPSKSQLKTIYVRLNTDANVANRTLLIQIKDASGNRIWQGATQAPMTASDTYDIVFSSAPPTDTTVLTGNFVRCNIPSDLPLISTDIVATAIQNKQAGDNYTFIYLTFETN